MNTYHKCSTTDKYEDSDESENCPGIMMSENKKIKVKKGWRFFSTLWTGKIVMVCRSKLSAAGRNAGVEAKAELYHHNDTWMVGAGFIILDTLDMECKVYPTLPILSLRCCPWEMLIQHMITHMGIPKPSGSIKLLKCLWKIEACLHSNCRPIGLFLIIVHSSLKQRGKCAGTIFSVPKVVLKFLWWFMV